MVICTGLQLALLDWSHYGAAANSALAIFYFTIVVVYPFFQLWFCNKYFKKLSERGLQRRFGSLWTDNNLESKGFMAYNFWFYFRRLMLGLVVVYIREILFVQLMALVV